MLSLRDLAAARGEGPGGALARLVAYDRRHRAQLVETLRAWLDAFGDVTTAAASQYVHPNTFRYRLRRITEVWGLDLDDPDERLVAELQLRFLDDRG
jgi:DNA-binding PucR family transcriptional regulator